MREARQSPASNDLPPWVKPLGDDCWRILVHVQPGAKKSEVAGEMEGRLRLRIAAQAVDNKANKALAAFVAELLCVRPNRVRLENGETSRKKTLVVTGVPQIEWNERLRRPECTILEQGECAMDQKELELLEKFAPQNEELRILQGEHTLYEKQLEKLEAKAYRTPAEEMQVKQLKKQKLEGKTKMVALLEKYARGE